GNPLPHLRLAEACCRVHALDEAVMAFSRAGDLLLGMGRRDDALKVIERLLHFRAEPLIARRAAELYLERGSREDCMLALAKLQISFQADPKDLDTLGLLARAFTGIGQGQKAIEVYKEMARLAREQGRVDLLPALIERLRASVPDEHAHVLESLLPPLAPPETILPDPNEAEVVEVDLLDAAEPAPAGTARQREARPSSRPSSRAPGTRERVRSEPREFDVHAHAKKALADAESFRRLRLFSKAVGTLNIALEVDPLSIEIRDKLRQILLEAGDREGAIAESVNIAAVYMDAGDTERAATLLREVLQKDPEHAGAIALLHQLTTSEAAAAEETGGSAPPVAQVLASEPPRELFGNDAPLPSYDLEEISPEQVLAAPAAVSPPASDALPSFALGEASGEAPEEVVEIEEISEIEEIREIDAGAGADASARTALEEALEEAEFFAARGLFTDARAILVEQLARTPHNRLVLERLREVEAELGSEGGSKTIERSQLGVTAPPDFDLPGSLSALDGLRPSTPSGGGVFGQARPSLLPTGVDVEKFFAKFKAGIRADVSDNDAATHYDLALAYREMGLLADAVKEFDLAARDPERECMCYAMIGIMHFEQGQHGHAIEAYRRALASNRKTREQELGLHYDMAMAHERLGDIDAALEHYQMVTRLDPTYRDVEDRIQALTGGGERPRREASGTRVVNDDDDFERVFDDLFESKSR
ncbi:MAG TPA: tetratricopeptide repeat protein, partial [Polyangiaceae bacterium]|nr:tetratricopeptide repeat protein [Polyangiaceae bacterium]